MQLFVAELLEKIQLLKGFLKGPISFVVLRLNSRELVDNLSSHIRLKKGSHDPPANPNRSSAAAPVGPGRSEMSKAWWKLSGFARSYDP